MMDVRALHTDADYAWALKEIERYFDNPPKSGTAEADRFDVLSVLIEKYEDNEHDVPVSDPIDVLHFAIDSMGRSQADLARIVGSRARASEILNRKRRLTLDMIRAISAAWKLPIETLTGHYELAREHA
ncbi:MAG: type II toxin-antitoxin system HigA family antitoxin [Variibacter sp.]